MTTTLVRAWRQPAPTREGLVRLGLPDPELWASRLLLDRERAARHQTTELASITAAVQSRSHELGAAALILTGSTARGARTALSDLDYHVIGARPSLDDLSADIDLYCDYPAELEAKLAAGDDFAHWSARYGCVLFDDGAFEAAVAATCERLAGPRSQAAPGQAGPRLRRAPRRQRRLPCLARAGSRRPLSHRSLVAAHPRRFPPRPRRAERPARRVAPGRVRERPSRLDPRATRPRRSRGVPFHSARSRELSTHSRRRQPAHLTRRGPPTASRA